ncbi:MAG: tyrosine-type recombinase/integrase [Acidobacteriia bacterium]|nr:tyrosine-type recombinase/integrase [Terriglobia bacterium]
MFVEEIPVGRNPMQLVQIKGVSRRTREIRILTWEEFSRLLRELEEPFCTMAIVAACCGLRVSEFLALKWDDVDWLGRRLRVERAIVMQHLGDCKTIGSQKNLPLADEVLAILRCWREQSAFTNPQHFIFASPVQIGRLPWSYPHVMRVLKAAATRAGIDRIGTHTFRHQLPLVAGRYRNSHCAAAKADASFGHQNHDEHLRRRDAWGDAEST